MNSEVDVIAAIDELERDAVDELVDWQLADSPAAVAEYGAKPTAMRFFDEDWRLLPVPDGAAWRVTDGAGGERNFWRLTPYAGVRVVAGPDSEAAPGFYYVPRELGWGMEPSGARAWRDS